MEALITVFVACNNFNWTYSERCNAPVSEFHRTIDGWEGTLTNGVPFTQEIVTPYIHIFKMEDMCLIITVDQTFECA
jgi:hypothetical protein